MSLFSIYTKTIKLITPLLYLYYIQVEEWYDWRRTVLGREGEIKRVYLASDDATVLNATIKMYDNNIMHNQW